VLAVILAARFVLLLFNVFSVKFGFSNQIIVIRRNNAEIQSAEDETQTNTCREKRIPRGSMVLNNLKIESCPKTGIAAE